MDGTRLRFSSRDVPALAIFVMVRPDGNHTGILHRSSGTLRILDLCWHECLRSSVCREDYACVVPRLEPEEENDVTAMCRLIESRNILPDPQKIPYGIGPPNNIRFNRDGELILEGGLGLTCSTFVLTVFESVRVPIADLTDWVVRSDDETRHTALIEMMRNGVGQYPPADPQHVARVGASPPCIRVRPEEVAAAGLARSLPIGFDLAEPWGEWVVKSVSAAGGTGDP